jgi:hypothetical protein
MKVNRHGKPSKAFTSRLKAPTRADYERMVSACVEAIVRGSADVLARFPYTLRFPKDFPRGILEVKYEDGTNVHRIKARKLLAWLNARGYTDITTDSLRGAIISSGLALAAFDEMCDIEKEG